MRAAIQFILGLAILALAVLVHAAEPFKVDAVSEQQAESEKMPLAENGPRTLVPAMIEFRNSAQRVEYPAGGLKLPGWLFRPAGDGPFPAVVWNHGSEKSPQVQVSLARFYTEHGFVFFEPIREGHGDAPGDYVVDLQSQILKNSKGSAGAEIVHVHDRFNQNVVDAVAWLKAQPFVDRDRIVMTGVSYGGIQTLLTAEKGLGIRAFIPFAPGAMSWANKDLQSRLEQAAKNAKAPVFLIQAKNDYSTGPSERLGPILISLGTTSGNKLYPAFGAGPQFGHAAFACWSLGTTVWRDDVLNFIDAAFKVPPVKR